MEKADERPEQVYGFRYVACRAYVTLEHEFILILRKGKQREFSDPDEKRRRRESAFFWEERNEWFSDVWKDLKGAKQNTVDVAIRNRSGAFPFELPYRLINMYSIKGDTVLDPFLGTGTTIVAAMAAGRNSIGFEIDPNFKPHIFNRFRSIVNFANQRIRERLRLHMDFVRQRTVTHGDLGYKSKHYGFPVMTQQETEIFFEKLRQVEMSDVVIKVVYDEK